MKKVKSMLVAYVDPTLIRAAKAAAESAGLGFSDWVARAVQQTMSRESVDRAIHKMVMERDEK